MNKLHECPCLYMYIQSINSQPREWNRGVTNAILGINSCVVSRHCLKSGAAVSMKIPVYLSVTKVNCTLM